MFPWSTSSYSFLPLPNLGPDSLKNNNSDSFPSSLCDVLSKNKCRQEKDPCDDRYTWTGSNLPACASLDAFYFQGDSHLLLIMQLIMLTVKHLENTESKKIKAICNLTASLLPCQLLIIFSSRKRELEQMSDGRLYKHKTGIFCTKHQLHTQLTTLWLYLTLNHKYFPLSFKYQ